MNMTEFIPKRSEDIKAYNRYQTAKLRNKYTSQGLCSCGREMEFGYKRCSVCRNKKTLDQEALRVKKYRKSIIDKLRGKDGRFRKYNFKHKYGITIDEYNSISENQNNLCAICWMPPGNRGLCVDHNHKTGKIRALLCEHCNLAIGLLREDINIIDKMKEYLIKYSDS